MPEGRLLELFLDDHRAAARIACAPGLIPAPGQYLLAHDPASDDPLAVPLFSCGSLADGFLAAPPLPRTWNPGLGLSLRGPLGHGFHLPASAQRVALVAWEASPAPLLSLLESIRSQNASVALACDLSPKGASNSSELNLPSDIEIQPLAALEELFTWSDYIAMVAPRTSLPGWRERLGRVDRRTVTREAQVLLLAPMPCGALAQCGVCSVECKGGNHLVCVDGPVFDLAELM